MDEALVIGSGITLTGNRLIIEGNGSVVLQGTLEQTGAAALLDIKPGRFTNSGTIRSAIGALSISPTQFVNTPSGEVITSGGTFLIGGNSSDNRAWNNQGLIQVANTTVSMGGRFTQADMGNFQRDAIQPGTVTVVGNVLNDLTLNASTGSWNFGGSGRLTNSRLTVDPSVTFTSAGAFTFDNVTIASNSVVTVTKDPLYVINGLTIELNAQLRLGDASSWGVLVSSQNQPGANTQLIDGNGSIVFNNQGNNTLRSEFNSPATNGELVIGSGITLTGNRLIIEGNGSIVLQGSLEQTGAAALLDIKPGRFTNSGTIRSAIGTLSISPTQFVNTPSGEVITSGGTFLIGGNSSDNRTWNNQGLIQVANTTVSMGGRFTQADMGNFQRDAIQPGTVTLVGNVLNDVTLNASTGSWNFSGSGRLTNSRLTVDPSVTFKSTGGFTFDDVTIASNSVVTVTNTNTLNIINGLTIELNAQLRLGDASSWGVLVSSQNQLGANTQLIDGNGSIVFNNQGNNTLRSEFNSPATHGELVVGSGITLTGNRLIIEGNGSIALQGTLEPTGAGALLDIKPGRFTNSGTIRSAIGTLSISPTQFINTPSGQVITSGGTFLIGGNSSDNRTWNNQGLIQIANTTVSLGGSFTQADMGNFQRDAIQPGVVTLVGNLTGPLTLTAATGTWMYGGGGRLKDSTLTVHPSVDFQSSNFFTFDNVHIADGTDVTVASSHLFLTIANGLTLNGRLLLGDNATSYGQLVSDYRLNGSGSQTINGNGRIEFNHQTNRITSNFTIPATGGTLVIGAGITLAEQNPAATNERIRFEGNGFILHQGTLAVGGSAARTEIVVTSFENQGTLRASDAAVIDVRPTTLVNFADVSNLGNNRFGVTLQGGTFEANDGTIRLFQGTNTTHSFVIKKLEAELILAGTMPRIYGHTTNSTTAIAELAEIGTAGALGLRNGVFYGPVGEVLVRGQVDVDATSRFGLAPSAPITTAGLKSYFAANGNYLNSATGAESIVATPVNGSGFSTGLEGQGFLFDGGNDHVTIPAASALNNPNLTVAAWYKLDQLQTGLRVLFGKTIGSGTLNSYAVWLNGDSINYGIGNGGGFDWQSVALVRQVGQWNHVALAFDDASNLVQLYLNGSLLHSFTTTRSISYDDNRPHVLGADIENGNPAYFFPGVIDEVRYYDRALSASEILDIAADSPLVATTIRQVDGEVRVGGSLTSLSQYQLEGGTLFGVGTLPTNLNQSGGTLAPGNSPGCLEIDGDYNLAAAGTLQIEIDGPTVCTQYDQLQVDGSVTLAGTLDVLLDPAYSPTIGQKFLVLENDLSDSIVGQFQHAGSVLRERQVFSVSGNQLFRISYTAGDGNDVELEFLGKGYLVSNTNGSGAGSLRQAALDANNSPGHDLVAFAIDDSLLVDGRYLINSRELNLVEATTIDATTQYDFAGNPIVEFRDQVGNSNVGITITASNSEVRGLSITNWATGIGVSIAINAENVRIAGNYVGIALDGSDGGGNGIGITIAPSLDSQVLIGGTTIADRNVISNSTSAGIDMFSVSNAVVQGNYIGTDPSGLLARPNERGIHIQRQIAQAADNNLIGGTAPGAGNLISGNTIAGIEIDANGNFMDGNQIVGNWIGVDATGGMSLANGVGIVLANSTSTNVTQNVISGNNTHGVLVSSASLNTVAGNIIGLNATGSAAVPNLNHGIAIENGSANNIIGGLDAASRNIISGNGLNGLALVTSDGNRILGNYLGTDVSGETELTNGLVAVGLNNSNFTAIGSSDGNINGNLIVGGSAGQIGIAVENQSNSNGIVANRFGLSASNLPLGYFGNAITILDSDQNVVGGATAAERNVIVQYSSQGIVLGNGSGTNVIIGNYVGVHPDGQSAVFTEQHSTYGVAILNSSNNSVGLAISGTGNLIGGNQVGVFVAGAESVGNSVDGNWVGLTAAGTAAIPNEFGIVIGDARDTSIGANAPNVVSGNRIGIEVTTAATRDTLIVNNWIGTDGSGSTTLGIAVGNSEAGISHIGGVRTLIRSNTIVASGPFGPFANPYGAVDVLGGDAVITENRIFNNFVDPIRTNIFPGTIVISQARLDGFALGEIANATPFTTFTIEFFEGSEQQQAELFVGSSFVVTDENGNAEFEISDLGDLTPGKFLIATISGALTEGDSNFNTSAIGAGAIPQVALIRGLPTRSPEGTPINLQAFAVDSTVSGYAITGYVWEVLKAGELYTTGNEAGIQFAPDDEGIYTVRLKLTLTNTAGDQQTVVLGPHNINVINVAPTPQFDMTLGQATIGQTVSLKSSSSDPGRDDLLQHTWEVRYGSPGGPVVYTAGPATTLTTTSFTPTSGGNHYVRLTVDDQDGGVDGSRSMLRLLQVRGAPSTTSILVPSLGSEGQTIRASAPESELQRADELTFAWQVLKNGNAYTFASPAAGVIEFTPDDDGNYVVSLTVSDGISNIVAPPQNVLVTNASPIVSVQGFDGIAAVGQTLNLIADIFDPGSADTHQVSWVVERSGAVVASANSSAAPWPLSFTPTQPGVYKVIATANDDDFDSGSGVGRATGQKVIYVAGSNQSLAIQNPSLPGGGFVEGNVYAFAAALPSLPPGLTVSNYQWSALDRIGRQLQFVAGSGPVVANYDFVPPGGGEYLAVLELVYSDGQTAQAVSQPIAVQGLAPQITSIDLLSHATNQQVFEGELVRVRTTALDTGERVGLTYRWELQRPGQTNWTVVSGLASRPSELQFTPLDEGVHRVRVTVSDSEGLSVTEELSRFSALGINVLNALPLVQLRVSSNSSSSVTFVAEATDPGALDQPGLQYSWSVNGGAFSSPSGSNALPVNLSGLSSLSVRVADDTGVTEVKSYLLLGSNSNDFASITTTEEANAIAVGADQLVYLGLDSNDTIVVSGGIILPVVVLGGEGNDTLNASAATGSVTLDGGNGDDTLMGGAGNDRLIAGPGSNTLVGGNGNNVFIGGGNDAMTGGTGDDYYFVHFSEVAIHDVAGGSNTIDLSLAAQGVTFDFGSVSGLAQTVFPGSTLAINGNFETLIGSPNDDNLTTNRPGTTLRSGGGNDRLVAAGTDITLDGGTGNSELVLANASGTFIGGSASSTVIGTLAADSSSTIELGDGGGSIDVIGALPSGTAELAEVKIVGGAGSSSISAERVRGKIYAHHGAVSGTISEFGAPPVASTRTITVSESSDIDIFGSAQPGNTIVVSQSQDIDIFGTAGDVAQLSNVSLGTINVSRFGTAGPGAVFTTTLTSSSDIEIFGSASAPSTLVATVSNSSDIDIFGSARSQSEIVVQGGQDIDIFGVAEGSILFTSDALGNSIARATIRISDFGSTTTRTLPITITDSQDIDIFGSASPTGTPLTATIDASSDIDIFGVATQNTSIIATNSSDIDIFGVLDGEIRLGPSDSSSLTGAVTRAVIESSSFGAVGGAQLDVRIHNSSEIDIFGGVSPDSSLLNATIVNSSDIDIFGSVRGGAIEATASQDIDIYGQGSASVTLNEVDGAAIFTQVFGSTVPLGPLQVTIANQSSDIDIFGSANRNSVVQASDSSDIDIFGGTAAVEVSGVTTWGDEVTLTNVSRARVVAGVFGSAVPQTVLNLVVVGNSSDIDIFGSALGNSQVTIVESQDIDIFGAFGDRFTLDSAQRVRVEGGLFGTASPGVYGLTATVDGTSQDIDIFGTSTDDLVDIFNGTNYRIALRGGTDVLSVTGAENLVAVFDQGDDLVTVQSGLDMLLYLASGNDRAFIRGGENVRVIGGEGDDEFLLEGGQQVDVDGGAGDDLAVLLDGASTILRLDGGENELRIFGGVGTLAVGGTGSDRMTVYGKLGNSLSQGQVYALLDGGDGNDDLQVLPLYAADDPLRDISIEPFAHLPSWMQLPSHIASPVSTTYSSSVALVGGAGNDSLTLMGNQRLFAFGGDGADTILLQGGSTSTISGGDGADRLEVRSLGVGNYVFGGSGDDQVFVYRGSKVGVFMEAGADHVDFDSMVDPISGTLQFASQSFARGGLGDDTFNVNAGANIQVAGEVGQNSIEVHGGSNVVVAGGAGHDSLRSYGGNVVLLLGEGGHDELEYHGGTDVILSGGDGDDRLTAFQSNVQLYGDDGDDWYVMGHFNDLGEVLIRELLFLDSENFEAEARGADTIDLSQVVTAGTTGANLDLRLLDVIQTVISGRLSLQILGAFENVIGTIGDDWLYGNDEANRLEGGGGNDQLLGFGGDDVLIGGDDHNTLIGGDGNDHYVIQDSTTALPSSQRIIEAENQGIDRLDFSQLTAGLGVFSMSSNAQQFIASGTISVTLQSALASDAPVAAIEELTGTEFDDFVVGNSLDNRFELLSGDDTVDGLGGDDLYVFAGGGLGSLVIQDHAAYPGRRTLDFAAFDAPIDIDLNANTAQIFDSELTLTLLQPLSIHNVVGTSFDDRILGNANDNALFGASGRDYLDGREGEDRLVGDLPQVVLLDFDSAYREQRGDYNYTASQRQQILTLIASRFAEFHWQFTLNETEAVEWTRDSGRTYVRLNFSEGRGGGVSGDAGEIDFRNINRGLVSQVNINSLKASLPAILAELLEREPTLAEIDDAIVRLSAHIAAHELGHTAGLRHADALGPIGSGFLTSADVSEIYPPYSGPFSASETRHHLIASPASLGTTIADALGETFWGARESIKLAFNEHGLTLRESNSDFGSHSNRDSTAQNLGGFARLYVPNLAPANGHSYSGSVFEVSAVAVIGNLASETNGATTTTERDVYRFTGRAGEWVNIEVMANGLRPMRGSLFDGQVKLYNSSGLLIGWNDDEFEGTKDAVLFDVQLPGDGEYFIEVSLSDAPAIDAPGDRYELFVSRFRSLASGSPLPAVPGDTLVGGLGDDELRGSPADDLFLATQAGGVDTIFGEAGFDTLDVLGLDYQFDLELLDSIELIANQNIAPQATLVGVPESPVAAATAWTVSLVNASDPSHDDTAAGFRYAFALKRADGSIAAGGLPATWSAADINNARTFNVTQAGTYTLVARIFDVRNAFRDIEASVTVEGSAANQPPTDILIDKSTIAENQIAGALVGNLSAVDPDASDTHHYQLVPGLGDTDNAAFEIVGNQLRARQAFDFEARSSYSIRVQVRDSADNVFSKSLTITVDNAPELIGSIVVGDGTVQRSLVKQLSLLFDTQLQLDAGAFIVQRRDFNSAGELMPSNVPIQVSQVADSDGRYRVVISFVHVPGNTTVRQGSLALQDGNYQLVIDGSKIRSLVGNVAYDAGSSSIFGDQQSHAFYSFFGDVRGLRVAGAFENNALRKTINKVEGDTGFDGRFDADGNGAVGAFDNNEMRKSLLKRTFNWR